MNKQNSNHKQITLNTRQTLFCGSLLLNCCQLSEYDMAKKISVAFVVWIYSRYIESRADSHKAEDKAVKPTKSRMLKNQVPASERRKKKQGKRG